MTKYLLSAASAAILALSSGMALAEDQDIELTADVESFCSVGDVDVDDIDLTVTDGNVSTTPSTHNIPVTCNGASTVTLTALEGGLNGPAAVSGFDNIINYTASASGFVAIPTASTAASPGVGAPEVLGNVAGGASATPLAVTVTPIGNTNPLLAGTFGDTLRVSIVAN
jgi:hypothetical protein